jgi:hypothetical protein
MARTSAPIEEMQAGVITYSQPGGTVLPQGPDRRPGRTTSSVWRALRDFWAGQIELHERMALVNRPWEEDYHHWSGEGSERRLHGSVPPPDQRRRYSLTRGGWCPGQSTRRPVEHRSTSSPGAGLHPGSAAGHGGAASSSRRSTT